MSKTSNYYDAFWMQNEEMHQTKNVYPWTFLEPLNDKGNFQITRYYGTIAQIAIEYELLQFGRTIKLPRLKKQQATNAKASDPIVDYDRAMRGL